MKICLSFLFLFGFIWNALGNPYYRENKVEKDSLFFHRLRALPDLAIEDRQPPKGLKVIRVDLIWNESNDEFTLNGSYIEHSGTEALMQRSLRENSLGSYKATLIHKDTGRIIGHASIGTGRMFRKLSRGLSFRFPYDEGNLVLRLIGEEPDSGEMIEMLTVDINPLPKKTKKKLDTEFKILKEASAVPKILLNFYAEGYRKGKEKQFWNDALKAIEGLERKKIPMLEHIEFRAVFSPSVEKIGGAQNLGLPVKGKDTFLGLYFPYWVNFDRWYHVVYPTNIKKYRDGLSEAAYDYPIILVDDRNYWGVGNFNELTAVPAGNSSFTYLLIHELGHFFGLNEEYEGGGRTELEFAYGIKEAWSQNMSFLREGTPLKWLNIVNESTPLPTPSSYWGFGSNHLYGAYKGGYADSKVKDGHNHKPGFSCIMASGKYLCSVCHQAFIDKIKCDSGM